MIIDINLSNKFANELNINCHPSNLKASNRCSLFLTKFEKDYNLNNLIKDDCDQCLLDNENRRNVVYYHTFWKLNSDFSDYQLRVLKLNLMSYLATQNLCCTRFLLWKLSSFPSSIENDLLHTFSYFFEKKIIILMDFESIFLCQNTIMFKNHEFCKSKIKHNYSQLYSVSLSDFVRFFVLGMYFDFKIFFYKIYKFFFRPVWWHI